MHRIARVLLAVAVLLAILPLPAVADTRTLAWTINAPGADTEVERGPVSGGRCSPFVKIATVPFAIGGAYVDTTAPSGFVCYRVRSVVVIDITDDTVANPTPFFSAYSLVDSNKPGNPSNLQVK